MSVVNPKSKKAGPIIVLFDSFFLFPFADKEKFVACTCNVGDSLAYVYSPSQGHVREITQGSHDIQSNRDMRDALGKAKTKRRLISTVYKYIRTVSSWRLLSFLLNQLKLVFGLFGQHVQPT